LKEEEGPGVRKKQKSGQAQTLTRYARLTARSGPDNQIASRGYHAAIILHGKSITVAQYVTLNILIMANIS
jgi:hypothetical protein